MTSRKRALLEMGLWKHGAALVASHFVKHRIRICFLVAAGMWICIHDIETTVTQIDLRYNGLNSYSVQILPSNQNENNLLNDLGK